MSVVDFNKATLDFRFLPGSFVKLLKEPSQHKIAIHLCGEGKVSVTECKHPERAILYLSVIFRLLNMAEENSAVQYRRHPESDKGIESLSALRDEAHRHLKRLSVTEAEIAAKLSHIEIEPTNRLGTTTSAITILLGDLKLLMTSLRCTASCSPSAPSSAGSTSGKTSAFTTRPSRSS